MTFHARALILLREPGTRPLRGALSGVKGVRPDRVPLIGLIYHFANRNRKYPSSTKRLTYDVRSYVRFRGQADSHLLYMSSSVYDPYRTCAEAHLISSR